MSSWKHFRLSILDEYPEIHQHVDVSVMRPPDAVGEGKMVVNQGGWWSSPPAQNWQNMAYHPGVSFFLWFGHPVCMALRKLHVEARKDRPSQMCFFGPNGSQSHARNSRPIRGKSCWTHQKEQNILWALHGVGSTSMFAGQLYLQDVCIVTCDHLMRISANPVVPLRAIRSSPPLPKKLSKQCLWIHHCNWDITKKSVGAQHE